MLVGHCCSRQELDHNIHMRTFLTELGAILGACLSSCAFHISIPLQYEVKPSLYTFKSSKYYCFHLVLPDEISKYFLYLHWTHSNKGRDQELAQYLCLAQAAPDQDLLSSPQGLSGRREQTRAATL